MPAYEEFGIDKEKLEEILNDIVFGKKYLLERKQKEVEKEVKAEIAEEEKEQLTTLEEIIATMTPFEKAILWAIGVGNRYIYMKRQAKIKRMGLLNKEIFLIKKEAL